MVRGEEEGEGVEEPQWGEQITLNSFSYEFLRPRGQMCYLLTEMSGFMSHTPRFFPVRAEEAVERHGSVPPV